MCAPWVHEREKNWENLYYRHFSGGGVDLAPIQFWKNEEKINKADSALIIIKVAIIAFILWNSGFPEQNFKMNTFKMNLPSIRLR